MDIYDAIIIGGGLLGASTAAALSIDGKKTLLLDAHARHHAKGSSHGNTRLTRCANYETPVFNQTAADSLSAMRAMEKEKGAIVRDVDAIYVARKNSGGYDAIKESVPANCIWEELDSVAARKFGFNLAPDQVAVIDRGAAVFNPTKVLDGLYRHIETHKGHLQFDTPLNWWQSDAGGVTVGTENANFMARQLVIAAGAWTPDILGIGNGDKSVIAALGKALKLERIPLFYFDYPADMPDIIPIVMGDDGRGEMYGMQEIRAGGQKLLKIGFHHGELINSPGEIENYQVGDEEKRTAIAYVERLFGRKMMLRETTVCLYAQASDRELPIIDALPQSPNVYLNVYGGGVCAKHAIALGNALSDVMQGRKPAYNLSEFSAERLTSTRMTPPLTDAARFVL